MSLDTGLPLLDYHAAPGVSKSNLDLIARSPAHYRYAEREETPAMRLGAAVHACVLEPDTWEARYTYANGRRRAATATARTVLTATEWETCGVGPHPVPARSGYRQRLPDPAILARL